MRLYLLPISTRRTLLYCQKLNTTTSSSSSSTVSQNQSLVDKATNRATKLWADWEKRESGWQKTVVNYGNQLFRRIPYEEWGLKSIPPLSTRRRDDELERKDKVQVVFPDTVIPTHQALGLLKTLGTEREALHKKRLTWCLVGMPISAPFALVPVIPNLPFFYLVYRAWSHWRALAGGKHITFLAENNLLTPAPSPILDALYPKLLPPSIAPKAVKTATTTGEPASEKSESQSEEELILSQANGRELVKALDIPELEVEIERAIWQVETAIKKQKGEHPDQTPPESSNSEKKDQ